MHSPLLLPRPLSEGAAARPPLPALPLGQTPAELLPPSPSPPSQPLLPSGPLLPWGRLSPASCSSRKSSRGAAPASATPACTICRPTSPSRAASVRSTRSPPSSPPRRSGDPAAPSPVPSLPRAAAPGDEAARGSAATAARMGCAAAPSHSHAECRRGPMAPSSCMARWRCPWARQAAAPAPLLPPGLPPASPMRPAVGPADPAVAPGVLARRMDMCRASFRVAQSPAAAAAAWGEEAAGEGGRAAGRWWGT
jgi:hypothetical protein